MEAPYVLGWSGCGADKALEQVRGTGSAPAHLLQSSGDTAPAKATCEGTGVRQEPKPGTDCGCRHASGREEASSCSARSTEHCLPRGANSKSKV